MQERPRSALRHGDGAYHRGKWPASSSLCSSQHGDSLERPFTIELTALLLRKHVKCQGLVPVYPRSLRGSASTVLKSPAGFREWSLEIAEHLPDCSLDRVLHMRL